MRSYELSNYRAKVLDRLVEEGVFPDAETALRDAVDNYLVRKRPTFVIVDPQIADDSAYRTQDQWISFFNEQRKRMISAPNIYGVGKSAPDNVLGSLMSDFDKSWVVSSTRISYSSDDLSGRITHNYESTVIEPDHTDIAVIPVYSGMSLELALQSERGVTYLQNLFATADDPVTISDILECFSRRKASEIVLWTPDQTSRKRHSERAIGFGNCDGGFHIIGSYQLGYIGGYSRGIVFQPRDHHERT